MEVSVLRIFSVLPEVGSEPTTWACRQQSGSGVPGALDGPVSSSQVSGVKASVGAAQTESPCKAQSSRGRARAGQRPDGCFSHCQGTVRGHPLCPALQLGGQVTPTLTNPEEQTVWRGTWGADATGMWLNECVLRESSKGLHRHSPARTVASDTKPPPRLSASVPRNCSYRNRTGRFILSVYNIGTKCPILQDTPPLILFVRATLLTKNKVTTLLEGTLCGRPQGIKP